MRYNTAPWCAVKEHWDGSRELRQICIKQHKGNVSDIFNEYPVLKQEVGYIPVCDVKFIFIFSQIYYIVSYYIQLENDYNALIDEKSNICNEWHNLSKKLKILLGNQIIRDKTFAMQLEKIQLYRKEDGNEINNKIFGFE